MCLTEDVYKKREAGNSKGVGGVHHKCFIQVSGPGPGGLEEMEVFFFKLQWKVVLILAESRK